MPMSPQHCEPLMGHIHLLLKVVSLPGFSCIENTEVDLQSPHQQDQTTYHMLPSESCLFGHLDRVTELQSVRPILRTEGETNACGSTLRVSQN